jgi:hypothetical protein
VPSTSPPRHLGAEPTGTELLAVLRACPIELVRGLLPLDAPDARRIGGCLAAGLIVLTGAADTRRWVLTSKGQQGLRAAAA